MSSKQQDSRHFRLIRGGANEKGWRDLELGEGEFAEGIAPSPSARSLINLVHISDLHICDAQSPARLEFLDRLADPHSPTSELIKLVGTYRAQDLLTTQTLEAMIRTINSIKSGVLTERPVDAVVITGDVTDNAQQNELSWYLTLLHGGQLIPDSGDFSQWEGSASKDPDSYNRSYWNPDGPPEGCEPDFPSSLYGFPQVPGLLDEARAPFIAHGLAHRWLATHGNHDALLQGTVAPDSDLELRATSDLRPNELISLEHLGDMMEDFGQVGPVSYPPRSATNHRRVTADPRRALNQQDTWISHHQSCLHDHGLDETNARTGTKYWYRDIDDLRLISLDTVNPHGGWQGSIDQTQFRWLQKVVTDPIPQYFVLLSHHPLETLFNLYRPEDAETRIGEREITDFLVHNPRVILWLAGHNHQHSIEFISNPEKPSMGFWHIQTASNIDWPQQGRRIEVLEDRDRIYIATTVFDHDSPIEMSGIKSDLSNPVALAGLSRILSANDWQRRSGEFDIELLAGESHDRNQILTISRH